MSITCWRLHHSTHDAFGNSYIPPGTIFFIPIHALHINAHNFSYPNDFWPERWLIDWGYLRLEDARMPEGKPRLSPEEFVHNNSAFVSFGSGYYSCVGKILATLEMRMVVTALIHKFEFRLREGWDPSVFPEQIREYISATKPSLPVVVTPRW